MTGHDHPHAHPHAHGEPENPWAGRGAVLLDIGGDVGALVVRMPAELTCTEVDIVPVDDEGGPPGRRAHVAVVARRVGSGTVPSLVYPDLVTGTYALCEKGSDVRRLTVHVEGGRVTQATWPAS